MKKLGLGKKTRCLFGYNIYNSSKQSNIKHKSIAYVILLIMY